MKMIVLSIGFEAKNSVLRTESGVEVEEKKLQSKRG